jgi:hypothetical protein
MKRKALRILMILGVVATMAPISVNAQSLNFSLDVPYAFIVGDKELPAGRYAIHRSPLGLDDVLVIESSDHKISQEFRMKIFLSKESATENKKLIFAKYGDQHFLSQIWAISPLGKSTRYLINKGKREVQLEKAAKQDQSAPQPEVVSLIIK